MSGNWVDISASDEGTFSGYLALPPMGKGPGIVLVQEIWGVNHHIRSVAEQFALAGPGVSYAEPLNTHLDRQS